MKAKFIYESLNFERGADPKDSMGVGIRYRRSFKTVRECANFFLNHIDKLSNGRFNNIDELKRAFRDDEYRNQIIQGSGEEDENPNSTLHSFAINRSPLRMCKDYLEGFKKTDNKGNVLSRKYSPVYIEEWGSTFDENIAKLACLKEFHQEIQKILGLRTYDSLI